MCCFSPKIFNWILLLEMANFLASFGGRVGNMEDQLLLFT